MSIPHDQRSTEIGAAVAHAVQKHSTAFVPGYEASAVHGVGAPHNTPAEIVEKLNRAINATLAEPAIKARLVDMGATLLPGSPADFGKLIADETEKWAKVVKFSGAKPD
jgi:tripartite-type tricarboxylate transporter receptor subunit TctC